MIYLESSIAIYIKLTVFSDPGIIWIFIVFQHSDKEFVLKFSAMEIYNEAVKDLLCSDSGPLRLLDDPEVNNVFLS